jgi:HK97 family phage portal protein
MKLTQRLRNGMAAFRKAMAVPRSDELRPVTGGFLTLANAVGDFFRGAWQQVAGPPDEEDVAQGLTVAVVYDCVRRISTDIAKMSPCVRRLDANGVWIRDTHQVFDRLIYRPNHFQTWFQFIVCWMNSKLVAGNTYVLKLYNGTTVTELIVLDPTKVTPMIAHDTGAVFYRVNWEPLARVLETMIVAADDLIHDRFMPLGHPLIGTSPLERALAGSRARAGVIQNAADLNEAAGVPAGILTTPEGLDEKQLTKLAETWKKMPRGRIAVVDAAYKFEALAAKYVDSQAHDIAELSGVDVCVAFGMPPWKLGMGVRPLGDPQALQVIYLQDTLQCHKEEIEQCLDHGLGVPAGVFIELDPCALLMMDAKTKATVHSILIKGIMAPNEARREWDLAPAKGGDTPYMQQQNYSLAALDARDSAAPAPSSPGASPAGGQTGAEPTTSDGGDGGDGGSHEQPAGTARPPTLPWAGVYDAAGEYPPGVFVTHDGGLWAQVAEEPALGIEPGSEDGATRHWALVVKRGKAPRA